MRKAASRKEERSDDAWSVDGGARGEQGSYEGSEFNCLIAVNYLIAPE